MAEEMTTQEVVTAAEEAVETVQEAVETAAAEAPAEAAVVEAAEEAAEPVQELTQEAFAAADAADEPAQTFEEVEAEVEAEKDAVWQKYEQMIADKTIFPVKVAQIVKGGAVAYVDDIRAFIPASRIGAGYVADLEQFKDQEIDVCIIEVDREKRRMVLSGREAARKKRDEERAKAVDNVAVGTILNGKVETLKEYGAFVKLENGLSGLVHVSQISRQRVNTPADVLKEGDDVTVKVIKVENHKLSLSIKALQEPEPGEHDEREQRERRPRRDFRDRNDRGEGREGREPRERREREPRDTFQYKEEGRASTGLADLLKDIKLD